MTGENTAPLRVPEVAALDIDHTFIDPDRAMLRLGQAIIREGVALPPDALERARQNARTNRMPFSPLAIVHQHTTPEAYDAVRQRFYDEPYLDEQGKPVHLIYDDVARFKRLLQQSELPRIFTTFGNTWQGHKLIAGGFTENMAILPTPDKTAYFKALLYPGDSDDTGEFRFRTNRNSLVTPTLCVIDNSIDAFYPHFPAQSRGFCIRRGGRFPADSPELSKLPARVSVITSFDELTIRDGVILLRGDEPLDVPAETPEPAAQLVLPCIPQRTWPASLPHPRLITSHAAGSSLVGTV